MTQTQEPPEIPGRFRDPFPDLNIDDYLDTLRDKGISSLSEDDLKRHRAHTVDDQGAKLPRSWRIIDCIDHSLQHDGSRFILSAGRWYKVSDSFSALVEQFFNDISRDTSLPLSHPGENEQEYNSRIADASEMLSLDTKTIKAPGASTPIEPFDFITKSRTLVFVKHGTKSAQLSHLFAQGSVSARAMVVEPKARDAIRDKIRAREKEFNKEGFEDLLPSSQEKFSPNDYRIVFAVLPKAKHRVLPFFSLVTLMQSTKAIEAMGYRVSFAWIESESETRIAITG